MERNNMAEEIILHSQNQPKYSARLLESFQEVYYKKFNKRITEQIAMRELGFLVGILKILLMEQTLKLIDSKGGKK